MRHLSAYSLFLFSLSAFTARAETHNIEDLKPFFQTTEPTKLHALIPTLTGFQVLRPNEAHIDTLKSAISSALNTLKQNRITASRANEAGLEVEAILIDSLRHAGIDAQTPETQSGRKRSVGYPDISFTEGDHAYYLEVKTFNARTIRSTMRTFYLSPSKDPKITRDASHLLVAIELEEPEADTYQAVSARLLDLYDLECAIKFEFNASNRALYDNALELFKIETQP